MKLRQILAKKLTGNELSFLRASFDIVGSIAILEIPDQLIKKEELIAKTLLHQHKNIKTVVKKFSKHAGKFRLQKYKILAGERKKETLHKENNVTLKLHIEKTYFSARLSTERLRICNLVKPDESVLVMFSGIAPYPINLSKNTAAKEIYGIEINPNAHKYALENIRINKTNNVELLLGDVRKVIPTLNKKFDRILMPLPKTGETFLDIALSVARKGTTIHFYDFLKESEFAVGEEKVRTACTSAKKKYKILRIVKCGQHSPHVYRICLDFQII